MIFPSLIWTAVGVVGLFVQTRLLLETIADRRFAAAMGWNGAMRVIAKAHIRTAVVRLAIVGSNTLLGVASVVTPPLVVQQRQLLSVVAVIVLTLSEIALVSLSQMDRNVRRKVMRMGPNVSRG